MAFFDWYVVTSDNWGNDTAYMTLQQSVVLHGSQSLTVRRNPTVSESSSTNAVIFSLTRRDVGSYNQGLFHGRMRTLFRIDNASVGFGFLVLASDPEFHATGLAGGGGAYIVGKRKDQQEVFVDRVASSVNFASTTSGLYTVPYTFALHQTYAMQVIWLTDMHNIGGVYIELWIGQQPDYSDLVRVFRYTDTSQNQLSVCAAEGLAAHWSGTANILANLYIDSTEIASLTLVTA